MHYRPFACRLARRYGGAGVPLDDLEQAACMGLVKAIQRFDPSLGFAFTSFATPTILGEVRRLCRETRWMLHVPRPVQERARAVRRASEQTVALAGRAPTEDELAGALRYSAAEVREARQAAETLWVQSIDGAPDDEDAAPADRWLGVEEPGYELAEDLAALQAGMRMLSSTELAVLRLRFGEDCTLPEIGARLRLRDGAVAGVLDAALERLRAEAGTGPITPRRPPARPGRFPGSARGRA